MGLERNGRAAAKRLKYQVATIRGYLLALGLDEEVAMSVMVIECPNTGETVSTGVEIDADNFEKLPAVTCTMNCAACGFEHLWMPSDAWLAPIDPAEAKSESVN